MIVSKNKVKQLASLKIKKYRNQSKQFIIEGDKIVRDSLHNKNASIREIIADPDWISRNRVLLSSFNGGLYEAGLADLSKISSMETIPPVLAILDQQAIHIDGKEVISSLSIGLDDIQDPGNLGTIIRTGDWFGIRNIFCSHGCADIYNPKVIQASMGAILNVKVHYVDLKEMLGNYSKFNDFIISGTFLEGEPVWGLNPVKKGIILFGNESRGISKACSELIKQRITIPPSAMAGEHVESLNVASSLAIVLAYFKYLQTK